MMAHLDPVMARVRRVVVSDHLVVWRGLEVGRLLTCPRDPTDVSHLSKLLFVRYSPIT